MCSDQNRYELNILYTKHRIKKLLERKRYFRGWMEFCAGILWMGLYPHQFVMDVITLPSLNSSVILCLCLILPVLELRHHRQLSSYGENSLVTRSAPETTLSSWGIWPLTWWRTPPSPCGWSWIANWGRWPGGKHPSICTWSLICV